MVHRQHIRCRSCERELAIRISVGGGLQRFVFPCPLCRSQLRGEFFAEQPTGPIIVQEQLNPFEIRSDDFELLPFDAEREDEAMLAVAVDTEIPVHVSMFSMPVSAIRETPFIHFVMAAGSDDGFPEAVRALNELRELRFVLLPALRRAAVFYAANDMVKLGEELMNVPRVAESRLVEATPWEATSFLFQIFLTVIGAEAVREAASREFVAIFQQAVHRDATAVREYVENYCLHALPLARRTMVDTFLATFGDGDALVAGLLIEGAQHLDLDEYRIQRSDFDVIKSRFQDIFELSSRILVLPTALANIALRGDVRQFADGDRRSMKQALKATAARRSEWLSDLPKTALLYDDGRRRTRNLIGHRLVSYDYERAALIDESGAAHNYLQFLVDYLNLVRTLAYVIDVIEYATDLDLTPPWVAAPGA